MKSENWLVRITNPEKDGPTKYPTVEHVGRKRAPVDKSQKLRRWIGNSMHESIETHSSDDQILARHEM